jgi:hypothetical protein
MMIQMIITPGAAIPQETTTFHRRTAFIATEVETGAPNHLPTQVEVAAGARPPASLRKEAEAGDQAARRPHRRRTIILAKEEVLVAAEEEAEMAAAHRTEIPEEILRRIPVATATLWSARAPTAAPGMRPSWSA